MIPGFPNMSENTFFFNNQKIIKKIEKKNLILK